MVPKDLYYTNEHEWIAVEDGIATIGITDYAQSELGDIVYVELPEVGGQFKHMEAFGTIEAVKTVADIFCPISGEVVEINEELEDAPEKINQDCYGDGWLVKIKIENPDDLSSLMGANEYVDLIEAEA